MTGTGVRDEKQQQREKPRPPLEPFFDDLRPNLSVPPALCRRCGLPAANWRHMSDALFAARTDGGNPHALGARYRDTRHRFHHLEVAS